MSLRPFHHAFPVHDLEAARAFYVDVMQCKVGRENPRWIDFDMMGHQVVAHLVDDHPGAPMADNDVEGKGVPVPHFGVVLDVPEWEALVERLEGQVTWRVKPHWRFKGKPSEQASMFFLDPSGNALEFKCYRHPEGMFDPEY